MDGRRPIILASASPRRRELLARMGVSFSVVAPEVDETVEAAPADMVRILCVRKADAVCARFDDAVVIAADTVVSLDGRALGKPADEDDALRMLKALSGRDHQVITGLCVTDTRTGRREIRVETSEVRFRALAAAEITAYVATGEPLDKAGAYAIQGGAAAFVDRFTGSYDNIVGLPSEILREILIRWSVM